MKRRLEVTSAAGAVIPKAAAVAQLLWYANCDNETFATAVLTAMDPNLLNADSSQVICVINLLLNGAQLAVDDVEIDVDQFANFRDSLLQPQSQPKRQICACPFTRCYRLPSCDISPI